MQLPEMELEEILTLEKITGFPLVEIVLALLFKNGPTETLKKLSFATGKIAKHYQDLSSSFTNTKAIFPNTDDTLDNYYQNKANQFNHLSVEFDKASQTL